MPQVLPSMKGNCSPFHVLSNSRRLWISAQVQAVHHWRGTLWDLIHGTVLSAGAPAAAVVSVEPFTYVWVHFHKALVRLLAVCSQLTGGFGHSVAHFAMRATGAPAEEQH